MADAPYEDHALRLSASVAELHELAARIDADAAYLITAQLGFELKNVASRALAWIGVLRSCEAAADAELRDTALDAIEGCCVGLRQLSDGLGEVMRVVDDGGRGDDRGGVHALMALASQADAQSAEIALAILVFDLYAVPTPIVGFAQVLHGDGWEQVGDRRGELLDHLEVLIRNLDANVERILDLSRTPDS